MSNMSIIIGNKNYSSWSLRAWLALKQTGVPFAEVMVVLRQPDTAEKLQCHSPSGKVPVLQGPHGCIWDTLAICEYLAESFPDAHLWPGKPAARARARSVCAEMHAGFVAVRSRMPMDLGSNRRTPEMTADLKQEISRIEEIWQTCRTDFAQEGPFLFGEFTIADCMFAPVVGRFAGYGVEVTSSSREYMNAVLGWPAMIEWTTSARQETWTIDI